MSETRMEAPVQGDSDVRDMLRESARDFVARRLPRSRLRALREAPQDLAGVWAEFSGLGWTGLMVPAEQGGSGLGLSEMAVVLEALGQAAAPEPLTPCGVLAARAIVMSESTPLRAELLEGLAAGSLMPALAWQSSARLAQAHAEPVQAEASEEGWRLHGRLDFVRPGAGWSGLLVPAQSAEGLNLFWVPSGSAGLGVRTRTLADGSGCAGVLFDSVAVTGAQRLAASKAASTALDQALDFARLAVAAELLGVIRGALAVSLEHLRTREQFGVAIGSFQALRHRAVELYLQQELVAASLEDATRQADAGLPTSDLQALAARVKARASAAALQVSKDAVQFHGAMGYTDECDVGLYLKRALTLSAWLGNASELLAQQSSALHLDPAVLAGDTP
ncbi:acyl-CoA dehydrogenase family protein [uncultured Hydrogenophaga sp.]|uniref:acyl-CoA dehydrogenase family protein n=1 Tax=uncultured Hydrogenophaga sp. TaxID=199683 RepID=UPI0025906364|nr:acyl-CoA dehydrogenase family protein [uncultured Hydrogenophaga sp.]